MKFTICDIRFTSWQQISCLNCRRRREESLSGFQFETRYLVSYKER
jgi:hypothetical protein